MEIETCPVRIWDSTGYRGRPCGRSVKGDGLCGIHLRAKNERARKNREVEEKWEADKKARAELQERLDNLGLEGDPVIAHLAQKRISVTIDELERIVNKR